MLASWCSLDELTVLRLGLYEEETAGCLCKKTILLSRYDPGSYFWCHPHICIFLISAFLHLESYYLQPCVCSLLPVSALSMSAF